MRRLVGVAVLIVLTGLAGCKNSDGGQASESFAPAPSSTAVPSDSRTSAGRSPITLGPIDTAGRDPFTATTTRRTSSTGSTVTTSRTGTTTPSQRQAWKQTVRERLTRDPNFNKLYDADCYVDYLDTHGFLDNPDNIDPSDARLTQAAAACRK